MDDSRRNLASPTSTNKRSQSDLKQKMRSLRGKENEETPKKHFMSPTFSASSKVRKKLSLIERNQQDQEEYNNSTVTFSAASSMSKKKNVIVEKHQDFTVSIYTCESSSTTCPLSPTDSTKPYDPFTNYLTPRPKFLLYNPHKQRQEVGPTKSQVLDDDVSSPQHGEGLESSDFEEDSDEEIEEEKEGVLYKVMKLLFVVCAIVFSTLYISSMNSPETGNLLALQGYRYYGDSANDFALGSVFLNQTLGKESKIGYDQIHFFDEGEGLDSLQVSVNENVEDSSELYDSPDPYVSAIQGFPILMESGDNARFDEKVTACESTGEKEMVVGNQVETVVDTVDAIGANVDKTDSSGESAKLEGFSYRIDSCEGPGEEEMVAEHQVETVGDTVDAIEAGTNPQDMANVDKTDSSGESAKMEGFSYKIDEQRLILGDVLGTCEVIDSARVVGDGQTMRTEEMVTDVVLAMGGIALLALTLKLVWIMFTKPSEKIPSPVIEECAEPVLVEDNKDLLLPKKDDSTEEKEQFAVEQRLLELCHFRAPTVELLGEYVPFSTQEFGRSSLKQCTNESSSVNAQQTKREIIPDSPASCFSTSLDLNRRYGQDKIVREKEEGSSTALRRSTRLRNKMGSSKS